MVNAREFPFLFSRSSNHRSYLHNIKGVSSIHKTSHCEETIMNPMKKLSRIYDSIFRKYATLGVPTGARRSISQNCWYAGSTSGKSVTGWENSFELDSSVKALPMVFS